MKEESVGPRDFARELATMADGQFNAILSAEQQKLVASLQDQALAKGDSGKEKGSITITIKYDVSAKGHVFISPTLKVTCPKPTVGATVRFVDKNGNLTNEDTRQQKLPLREVAAPPIRDLK
ncbi:MAG: hypothetical protein WC551_07850 [Patescibacteria group bacterium]